MEGCSHHILISAHLIHQDYRNYIGGANVKASRFFGIAQLNTRAVVCLGTDCPSQACGCDNRAPKHSAALQVKEESMFIETSKHLSGNRGPGSRYASSRHLVLAVCLETIEMLCQSALNHDFERLTLLSTS